VAPTLNVPIRFTSGLPGTFPSADAYLVETNTSLHDNTTWTISYADAGPDVADTPITGTVQTHGCCPGEFLDLTSVDDNFMGTMYQVAAATITTVTVLDFNNQTGNQTAANIGTIAHQERLYCGTTNCRFPNVSFQINQASPSAGPGWDLGSTLAWRPEISGGFMTGLVGTPEILPPYRDDYRMAALFAYGGQPGGATPGVNFYVHDGGGSGGSIYALMNTSSTGVVDARRMIFEPGGSSIGFPLLAVEGNPDSVYVHAEDLGNADQIGSTVVLVGIDPQKATIIRCDQVTGGSVNGNYVGEGTPYVVGVGSGQLTVAGSFSPKKYHPVSDRAGNIQGWIEIIDATVNP
jgi:hypothetical protein